MVIVSSKSIGVPGLVHAMYGLVLSDKEFGVQEANLYVVFVRDW